MVQTGWIYFSIYWYYFQPHPEEETVPSSFQGWLSLSFFILDPLFSCLLLDRSLKRNPHFLYAFSFFSFIYCFDQYIGMLKFQSEIEDTPPASRSLQSSSGNGYKTTTRCEDWWSSIFLMEVTIVLWLIMFIK